MLPEWCSKFVGLPYLPGGRTREGLDCWGLFALIWAEQFGRALPDYDGLSWRKGADAEEVARCARSYAERFRQIDPGTEQCGDGILFRMRGVPLHLGMVVYSGKMLHIEDGADACIETYTNFQWSKRIIGFYRFE